MRKESVSPARGATRSVICSVVAVLTLLPAAARPGEPANTPEGVTIEFITALDHLDLERLLATLTDDATMFFPHPDATFRVDGKPAIAAEMERRFAVGLEAARRAGRTEPPYLGVVAGARERVVQMLGESAGLVTWVVDRPGNFGRRTAVVRRDEDGTWRLVHFHSSNLRSPAE